jgi:hypothetical protein
MVAGDMKKGHDSCSCFKYVKEHKSHHGMQGVQYKFKMPV